MKIYEVEKSSLQEFAPEDDRKYSFENFPHEQFRRTDLEISGSDVEESEEATDDMFIRTKGDLNKLENRFTHLRAHASDGEGTPVLSTKSSAQNYDEFKEDSDLMN